MPQVDQRYRKATIHDEPIPKKSKTRHKNLYMISDLHSYIFKMAVIPLVPETKMRDVAKLTSLENLLIRKITWFLLTSTSAALILSRAFGAEHMIRIAYIYSRLPRTHFHTFWLPETALSLSLFISTSRNSLTLPLSKARLNTRNLGAYTFLDLFLTFSAFSVRFVPVLNTASEISPNPERDKQPTWEKTRSS